MDSSEIIREVLNTLNVNAKTLSEILGYDRPQAIYDLKSGKTKAMSNLMANKIVSVFPQFEKGWLLTGEGEMLRGLGNRLKDLPGVYEKSTPDNKMVDFLMDANRSLEKIVHNQNDIMLKMQDRITFLESELEKAKNELSAQEPGAGCAAVG